MLRHTSSSMLRFEDALATILSLGSLSCLRPAMETARLEDADGRVLASDLIAACDLPTTEMRGGDGYLPTARIQRAEELPLGAVALTKGTRLRPAHLALAHALGYRELSVAARPVVTVVSAAAGPPASLAFALRASALRAGATVNATSDDAVDVAASLPASDVVITTTSLARASGLRASLHAAGASMDTWRIAIKPGSLLGVGTFTREGRRPTVILSLGDNPASALVGFALFAVPLLRNLQGDAHPFPAFARAHLTRAHAHDPGLLELARATVGQAERGYTATTLGGQPGGGILSMARADALVCITEDANGAHAADDVDLLLMSDLCG